MPTYDMLCEQCGEPSEMQLSIDDRNSPQECPKCGSRSARRTIATSAPRFVINGFNAKNKYGLQ